MGLGGHLIWSAVIRQMTQHTGRPVVVCDEPLLSDVLRGHLYNTEKSYEHDPVFEHNPRVIFPPQRLKPDWARRVDRWFFPWFSQPVQRERWEKLIRALCGWTGRHYCHIDMRLHQHTDQIEEDRVVWKRGTHLIDIVARNFGLHQPEHQPELFFTAEEEQAAHEFLQAKKVVPHQFVALEPHSKIDWFGDLRTWPWDHWVNLTEQLRAGKTFNRPLVQVGVPGKPLLPGVVDLTEAGSFRRAALILKKAALFVGTEGGLMHAAQAVGAPAVIIYGGVTLPEYSGYPQNQRTVCRYVECAPCGRRRFCPYDKKCLNEILPETVAIAIQEELDRLSL
jgi:hypothetical protein